MKRRIQPVRSGVTAARMASAFHEAGHAVVAVLTHRAVEFVRLEGRGRHAGLLRCSRHPRLDLRGARNHSRSRWYICREVMIAWGGVVAESMYRGRRALRGAGNDFEMVETYLRRVAGTDEEIILLGRILREETRCLLQKHWRGVETVARRLADKGWLAGRDLRQLLRS